MALPPLEQVVATHLAEIYGQIQTLSDDVRKLSQTFEAQDKALAALQTQSASCPSLAGRVAPAPALKLKKASPPHELEKGGGGMAEGERAVRPSAPRPASRLQAARQKYLTWDALEVYTEAKRLAANRGADEKETIKAALLAYQVALEKGSLETPAEFTGPLLTEFGLVWIELFKQEKSNPSSLCAGVMYLRLAVCEFGSLEAARELQRLTPKEEKRAQIETMYQQARTQPPSTTPPSLQEELNDTSNPITLLAKVFDRSSSRRSGIPPYITESAIHHALEEEKKIDRSPFFTLVGLYRIYINLNPAFYYKSAYEEVVTHRAKAALFQALGAAYKKLCPASRRCERLSSECLELSSKHEGREAIPSNRKRKHLEEPPPR